MRIGILTWFHHENYGTKLQAIALQQYLKTQGHLVELINYTPKGEANTNEKNGKDGLKHLLWRYHRKKNVYWLQAAANRYCDSLEIRRINMKQVIIEHCSFSPKIEKEEEFVTVCNSYDTVICGSDQIWNPNWLEPFYFFGADGITAKKLAYAPSFGVSSLSDFSKEKIRNYVNDFSFLSVREESGANILENITGKRPGIVADPTLLLSDKDWDSMLHTKEEENDYVFCYFLGENKNHWKAAQRYAKKHQLEIKIIPQSGQAFFRFGEILVDAGVEEFVTGIKNARAIFTDSYHAEIFSLIYQKEFFVFERFGQEENGSQNSRIHDFSNRIGVKNRVFPHNHSEICEDENLDDTAINANLESFVKQSKQELLNALKGECDEML